ncbi:MAG TPA: hypothetical protein VFZ43_00940 [Anaerolineales bacterium]
MSTDRAKLTITIYLTLGVLLLTLGCNVFDTANNDNSLAPIRRFRLFVDKSQRDELISQFQKFAEEREFEIDITDYNTNGETIQVWIAGDGLQITVFFNRKEPNEGSLNFYDPGPPTDEETINELLNDLKRYINEIPNVTITEE